jgi:HSP20 family protein
MALVKWNPAQGLVERSNEIDRWFNNFFNTDRSFFDQGFTMSPLINVEETDNEYVISAEIPGVKKEDLNVSFENNVIHISAEKKAEKDKKENNYHYGERSYGKFYRSIPVPSSVKIDEINAEYKDGVLNISVQKTEEAKPKSINVKIK